ncbi:MAG: rhodanese-like domain protein [Enterovirga sp.]|nr:rhodanese-like domain protein [Enterovirga sp.]
MTLDQAAAPPLLAPADLAGRLGDRGLVVLDVRSAGYGGGRAAFDSGHIPGSVHSDYVADGWREAQGAAPGLLPSAESLSELFGRLGIRPDDHVVVVPAGMSSGDFSVAARIFWTFRAAGHRRLSMLDGGFTAWLEGGFPIDEGAAVPPEPTTYAVTPDPSVRALLPEVEQVVAGGGAALVDSRGPKSFLGEEKSPQAARAGRLPGAVNVEGLRAYDARANRLRPREELEALFAPVPAGPAIPYCNTGQAAATDWFVLSEVLRRPEVRLYDGSMSEWTADPSRPVETGPDGSPG